MKKLLMTFMSMMLVLVIVLTGCETTENGANGDSQGTLTAGQILQKSITAMDDSTSYSGSYEMTMDIVTDYGDDYEEMAMAMNGEMVVDIPENNMKMTLDMQFGAPDEDPQMMAMDIYILDEWMYMRMDILGIIEQWMKMEYDEDSMSDIGVAMSQEQIDGLTQLMGAAVESELRGTEKVNGENCYVVEVVPDMPSLWDLVMSQMSGADMEDFEINEDVPNVEDIIKNVIKSFEITYWIDADSFMIAKESALIEMYMDEDITGEPSDEFESVKVYMDMAMEFFDYNQNVDIILPDEAKDAEEMTY